MVSLLTSSQSLNPALMEKGMQVALFLGQVSFLWPSCLLTALPTTLAHYRATSHSETRELSFPTPQLCFSKDEGPFFLESP